MIRNLCDMHAPYASLASRRYAPSPEAAGRTDQNGKPIEKYYDYDLTKSGAELFKAQYVRLVGGSTWAWRGNTPRLVPGDFKLKTMYGIGDDWPISYDDLEPWYVEAERELRFLADRRSPDRYVLDLSKAGTVGSNIILEPRAYHRIANFEDRLFIDADDLGLFLDRGYVIVQ